MGTSCSHGPLASKPSGALSPLYLIIHPVHCTAAGPCTIGFSSTLAYALLVLGSTSKSHGALSGGCRLTGEGHKKILLAALDITYMHGCATLRCVLPATSHCQESFCLMLSAWAFPAVEDVLVAGKFPPHFDARIPAPLSTFLHSTRAYRHEMQSSIHKTLNTFAWDSSVMAANECVIFCSCGEPYFQ